MQVVCDTFTMKVLLFVLGLAIVAMAAEEEAAYDTAEFGGKSYDEVKAEKAAAENVAPKEDFGHFKGFQYHGEYAGKQSSFVSQYLSSMVAQAKRKMGKMNIIHIES